MGKYTHMLGYASQSIQSVQKVKTVVDLLMI